MKRVSTGALRGACMLCILVTGTGGVLAAPAAAAPGTAPPRATVTAAAPAAVPAAMPTATLSPTEEYRLGAGDVIRINVYQNPDLSVESRITDGGIISYPLLGNVRVGGQTVTAAEKLLADGLRAGQFVKQPQVTISVMQVRGHQASVLGMVNRPGRYPIELANTRLSDLLALAGGPAAAGAETLVVTGQRGGQPFRVEVDVPTLFTPAGRAQDILVQNGDTVWIDRQPQVYIYGEVQRPGPMRLERNMTLMQALATGGGLTQRGTDRGIKVHRKNGDGKVSVVQPGMDYRMQDGDVVFVRESLF